MLSLQLVSFGSDVLEGTTPSERRASSFSCQEEEEILPEVYMHRHTEYEAKTDLQTVLPGEGFRYRNSHMRILILGFRFGILSSDSRIGNYDLEIPISES